MPPVIAHVVGARPNFMKAAPVIAALRHQPVDQRLIHTGQHYDAALSAVFFGELDLPEPDIDLGVGSGSHARQTGAIMVGLERDLDIERPAMVVVYGDVNSTLAGAIVGAKLHLPVAHVEAGLRSLDRTMPEEVNRIVTDSLADVLFATSPDAVEHLDREGADPAAVHLVGNPMIDTLLANLPRLDAERARAAQALPERYGVVTLHRPGNVDTPEAATAVASAIVALAERLPLIVPLHPRGRAALAAGGLVASERLRIVEPLGYVEFMSLVRGATVVVTDSGGVQEETTVLGVACLTVRPNTERPITISHGTNRLVRPDEVVSTAEAILRDGPPRPAEGPPLWDGHAGERIAAIIAAEVAVADRPA